MTVASIGVLCNSILIIVIVVDPLKILRRGAWITILNLALADFIACAGLFFELLFYQIEDAETLFLVINKVIFFRMFGQSASFLLLTLLTVEIYLIIKYPMKSRVMLTDKKAVLSCAFVWLLAIGLGLCEISYVWTDLFLYFYIGNIAVLELTVAIQVVLKIFIAVEILSSRHSILNVETLNEKQQDVAKTVMILNAILIVTAFPYFLAKQMEYVERLGGRDSNSRSLRQKFAYYYEPVALLNFVLNAILYSLRLQDYRRSLLVLFKCKCKRHRRSNSTSQQRFITAEKTEMSQTTKL
ncbi:adenosine receptor A1-like [Paramuricea clavata]|uniref:Adenosine receptor A1-like n=1 Tax=Paramuricea clavata TaxID=317549 RepID=A0A6S7K0C1_PARCT|nr:adenosine receptor A1-like [Paramuricea clavata]